MDDGWVGLVSWASEGNEPSTSRPDGLATADDLNGLEFKRNGVLTTAFANNLVARVAGDNQRC